MAHPLSDSARQKFDELGGSVAHSRVVAHLRRLVTEGSDFDCYKLNAFRFASEVGVPRHEVLRTLLFATRLGLFDLHWDIHCPSCSGLPEYHKHLMSLANTAHCDLCQVDWEIAFDQQVEVTFTPNPQLRSIAYRDWSERSFPERQRWWNEVLPREDRLPVVLTGFDADENRVLELDLPAGTYDYYKPPFVEAGGVLRVAGERTAEVRKQSIVVLADGAVDVQEIAIAPGDLHLAVSYRSSEFGGFIVRSRAPKTNWVSAAYVTALQDFRDLFAAEFLAPGRSFALRSVCLMFTDITGSTAMYERLGDSRAYTVVQGAAGAGEVVMSHAVYDDPNVRGVLADRGLSPERRSAMFKGIEGESEVLCITPGSSSDHR